MRSIGMPELIVILIVAVLLFGGKKIPEIAKGLGEGIRNFKSANAGVNSRVLEDHSRAEIRLHKVQYVTRPGFHIRVFLNTPDASIHTPTRGNENYVGMLNVFNTAPPVVYNAFTPTSDSTTYDFVGRYMYGRISHAF